MIEKKLNEILNEFANCKIEKDNFIKEEIKLNAKSKESSLIILLIFKILIIK